MVTARIMQERQCRHCGKPFKLAPSFPFLGSVMVADCECGKDSRNSDEVGRLVANRMSDSRVPSRLAELKFETYPGSRGEVDRVMEYLTRRNPGLLLLVGAVGRGKSALACAALEKLAEDGTVRYFYAYDLLVERVTGDTMSVLRSAADPKSIVIDEIGLQLKTPAANEFMERLLIGRHDDMKNTILISNLGAAEFRTLIGTRAWDRAANDGSVVVFEGETFRGR